MDRFPLPSDQNGYLAGHIEIVLSSLRKLTGRELLEVVGTAANVARQVFEAPFFLASHNADADPVMTYGNRCALDLFECTWDEFTSMPSRLTAEMPDQAERARLLAEVTEHGYIDDYSGVRVSRTGRRMRIQRATVWNLTDPHGLYCGQAAMFRQWDFL